jgi:hypothetical protein
MRPLPALRPNATSDVNCAAFQRASTCARLSHASGSVQFSPGRGSKRASSSAVTTSTGSGDVGARNEPDVKLARNAMLLGSPPTADSRALASSRSTACGSKLRKRSSTEPFGSASTPTSRPSVERWTARMPARSARPPR